MKELINDIFGQGRDLTTLQMTARAILMFFITLSLIRLGGVRIFGKRGSFDNIIAVMMGALLSRGVTGASPFLGVVAATTAMVIIHRVLGASAVRNKIIERFVKGRKVILFKDGKLLHNNLMRACMSLNDILESLRLETKQDSLDKVEVVTMETNGRISFIMKNQTAS
jgi:uncharacterized membrane protein YcaP (DUF421 family)